MNAMQYKIILPDDYDMSLIRKRVEENGAKTDHLQGLLFKAYLISEKVQGAISNSYSPLYVWENTDGMNQFIFGGFYDNIIHDFGWQTVQIGVPLTVDLKDNFSNATYLLEQTIAIPEPQSLTDLPNELLKIQETLPKHNVGKLIVYNPDKWKAVIFGFYTEKPLQGEAVLYEILHVSAN
ncbi:hypothetical protein IGL98_003255 [Enterococcus sp. DIV0840]|uniref:DUF4865 family protein n=1 Tax=Enterococcus TaxID=1350 RepID=UPI001A8EC506|nr:MULTISPECIES: DUF4865 family protein [Enterococcus]MBO0434856.1 DUF4865 family protein [Enterococcus sp. DIV0849a]MBO0475279.1 DUF4865 family protein [Enterococcus ureasiticus]